MRVNRVGDGIFGGDTVFTMNAFDQGIITNVLIRRIAVDRSPFFTGPHIGVGRIPDPHAQVSCIGGERHALFALPQAFLRSDALGNVDHRSQHELPFRRANGT